jgi:hypothetical protein
MKALFILCTLLFFSSVLFAQDTLFMKKGQIIPCKITEIRIDEITYKDFDNLDGPNIIIRKSDVNKIHYQNGKVVNLVSEETEVKKETKIIDKNDCIKFIFLSPLFENLGFVYERKLKMGLNLEIKAGYIGIGNTISNLLGNKNTTGAYICGGVKFILGQKSHDYYIDGVKFLHPLCGRYIKPELIFSTIKYSQEDYYYPNYTEVTYRNNLYGINIIFGKQYILGKSITFDPYFGVGYGFISTKKISGTEPHNEYSTDLYNFGGAIMLMNEFPILVTGGFTFGYIFK